LAAATSGRDGRGGARGLRLARARIGRHRRRWPTPRSTASSNGVSDRERRWPAGCCRRFESADPAGLDGSTAGLLARLRSRASNATGCR
jgi:hypothetical protein